MNTKSQPASAIANLLPHPLGAWRLAGLILACLAGSAGVLFGQTAIPELINYQGKITDAYGNSVQPGYYEGNFKIWSHATSTDVGAYVWGRSFAFHVVTNGMFNVMLSNDGGLVGSPLTNDLKAAFDGATRYLGLTVTKTPAGTVATPTEISPRQQLVSAPFAIHANDANNASTFSRFSTNDFLMANRLSQTLTGKMTMSSNLTVNGNIGINVANPLFPLTFPNTHGDKISLYGQSGAHYGFGIQGSLLQMYSSSSSTDIGFGYGESTNFTERMRIRGNGNVGIGTTAPSAKLHVNGALRVDLSSNGGGDLEILNNNGDNSIYIEGYGTNKTLIANAINITAGGDHVLPLFQVKATNSHFAGNITADGAVSLKGLSVNGSAPIVFERYYPANPTTQGPSYTQTSYSSTTWAAVVAGFKCDGDFEESGAGPNLLAVTMSPNPSTGYYRVQFDVRHDALTNILVDVMFIRRELVQDNR